MFVQYLALLLAVGLTQAIVTPKARKIGYELSRVIRTFGAFVLLHDYLVYDWQLMNFIVALAFAAFEYNWCKSLWHSPHPALDEPYQPLYFVAMGLAYLVVVPSLPFHYLLLLLGECEFTANLVEDLCISVCAGFYVIPPRPGPAQCRGTSASNAVELEPPS